MAWAIGAIVCELQCNAVELLIELMRLANTRVVTRDRNQMDSDYSTEGDSPQSEPINPLGLRRIDSPNEPVNKNPKERVHKRRAMKIRRARDRATGTGTERGSEQRYKWGCATRDCAKQRFARR